MRRVLVLVAAGAMLLGLAAPGVAQASLTLLRPDPLVSGTFYGHGGLSTDAASDGPVRAEIPAGATVVGAWVYAAGTPWETPPDQLTFGGLTVAMTTINRDGGGAVARGDVTDLVSAAVSSEGGIYSFGFENPGVEGVALAVVYADASAPNRTIAILDGGAVPTGDTATFSFASPIDPTTPGFEATLALGITFSYQSDIGNHICGGGQTSLVDVNGARVTSCAGSADDSTSFTGLITMGGVGDSTANPPDANGPGGEDDELYDLVPFLTDGDTALTVSTVNPSNDDYIFFAGITITARASVATTGSPTIGAIADQAIAVGGATAALPFAVDDAETAAADLTVTATSSDQAVIADSDIALGGAGADRTVTVTSGGTTGSATIALTVTDGDAKQSVTTFLVTVEAGPTGPTATADTADTNEDVALDATSVLANDTNPGSDPLTAELVTDVTHGGLTLAADGTFRYVPDADFNGTDSFTYRAVAGETSSAPATVTITVAPIADVARCTDGTLAVARDTATTSTLACADPDGDAVTIELVDPAAEHGTVSGLAPATGDFTYTPDAGFHGLDTIWFRAADVDPSRVAVTVGGGNAAPAADPDTLTVDESLHPVAALVDVLANDSDADEDALTLSDVSTAAHGAVAIVAGKASYTPDPMFAGTDAFSYTVTDGFGGSTTGNVAVNVVADVTGPSLLAPTQAFIAPSTATRTTTPVRFSWTGPSDATGVVGYDVELSTDGHPYVTVRSVLAPTRLTLNLTSGHQYQVRVRSVDGAGNRGPWAFGARARVVSYQTPAAKYAGSWHIVTQGSSSGTGFRYTNARWATATLTTTGRAIAWVAPTNRASGVARVYVDGVYRATVNLQSTWSHERQVVFEMTFATPGSHTIQIRNMASAGHPRMSLDAFVVLR